MAAEPESDTSAESPTDPVHVRGADHLATLTRDHEVVLADFYADWCGPCRMIEPMVERIAAETDATVAKVDVDANQRLAGAYGVRGVPTLVLFAGGEEVDRTVGAPAEDALRSVIARYTD